MKTALLLSLASAAAVVSGCCCANQGGTADTYNTQTGSVNTGSVHTYTYETETGSVRQTEPEFNDPSIAPGPDDGNFGPQIPPP